MSENQLSQIVTLRQALDWLKRDLVQRGAIRINDKISLLVFLHDPLNYFMCLLRLKEWSVNAKVSFLFRWPIAYLFRRQSIKLGFSIPPNTFGSGLAIVHYGNIVVNGNARIGENCRIHVGVNIGGAGGLVDNESAKSLSPSLGCNIYIAPGAKIYGPVRIADNIAIGANAVVNRSFTTPGVTIAGMPAKKISEKGSTGMIFDVAQSNKPII